MTFSVKLFTIVSAVLAAAVNGSPVEFAEGGLQARNEQLGKVKVCTGSNFSSGCKEPWVDTNTCFGLMESAQSFSHNRSMVCVFYTGGHCDTQAIPPTIPFTPLVDFDPTNDLNATYEFSHVEHTRPSYENCSPVCYYDGPINSYQCRAL